MSLTTDNMIPNVITWKTTEDNQISWQVLWALVGEPSGSAFCPQARASGGHTAFEVSRFTWTATRICAHLTVHKCVNRAGGFPLACLQRCTNHSTTTALLSLTLSEGVTLVWFRPSLKVIPLSYHTCISTVTCWTQKKNTNFKKPSWWTDLSLS